MTLVQEQPKKRISFQNQYHWIWDVLLVVILVAGAYFRFIGINWDDNHHVHPDERFLTMVATSISPVKAGEYFNTDLSTLNPHNVGYSYYVYGTFPLFIVRYVGEWLDRTGYDQIFLVGRFLAGLFDLFTVFLVYLIAYRIYKRPGLSVLAAAFSAFAVLQIQQSHYFTVDSFLTFFVTLSLYFAIRVMTS
ncbi:MAG TPA: phospholipid carrier-dependent glycosyltransferase, partial [Anaerolineaceae bacterium]|nr:phospholipid carrier-dependent glycosyltransferase [Anaerolineaceae bacterium]